MKTLQQFVSRLLCTVPVDGALGAACGALYGFVFGGFGALQHNQQLRSLSMLVHFTEWGLGIGALVGVLAAVLNPGEPVEDSAPAVRDVAVIPLRMASTISTSGTPSNHGATASEAKISASRQALTASRPRARASA
jgi:hypothetical protein